MNPKDNMLGILGSLTRQQEDFNRTMRQLTAPEPQVVESAPALPAPVEVQALPPVAAHDPKAPLTSHSIQPSPVNDELAEQIMAELEKVETKGLTPRDLGKRVQALVPGKTTVPPHQRYRFRTVMQHLVSEGRISRLDADDPKKLRYVTASFAVESQ
jgi:hypothetical protein